MKVDLPPSDGMRELKSRVAVRLRSRTGGKDCEFRVQLSLTFALNEVTRGLARLFPHRRSIAYVQGCGPYFEPLMKYFSAEGFSLQAVPFTQLKSPAWLETLKKDSLFVLLSDDDPLTGQLFETAEIQAALEAKKIFSILTSHAAHNYRETWSMSPYLVRVLSGGPQFALSLLGDRAAKIEPLLFGPADWVTGLAEKAEAFFAVKSEDRDVVRDFENARPGSAALFFSEETPRLFDRAALYWTDMDGEAFVHELAMALKVSLLIPGSESRIETASLCRWKGMKTLSWLNEQGIQADVSRGLVLIARDLIDSKLSAQIEKVRTHLLKIQNG
ncbi:MAG: hypothetical protein ABL958_08350 [Bdellovibrionia bacterium]